MSIEQAQTYLAKVLAWPQEGEAPAYVNIHWSLKKLNQQGKNIWTGRATRSLQEAANTVSWALRSTDTKDIYVCLSTQRDALEKVSGRGNTYLAAIRSQENVVTLKSLFLDIDAKGEDKDGYATVSDAIKALTKFIADVDLPLPSAIVNSGGGLHVYWTFMRPLSIAEWQPLAFALAEATKQKGLKCDTQCTIDAARILRVPGTFNRKLEAARPVTLAGNRVGSDYSVERIESRLHPYRVPMPAPAMELALFPRRAAIKGESELAAGIDRSNSGPVKLDDVTPECPFLKEAVDTQGASYTNPLWNLTTLLATFTVGGRTDAHRMASGHAGYSTSSTDELYDRKEKERQAKGLGWPSCRTISGSGSTKCQGCVHFGKNKSPLNFAARPAPAPSPAPAVANLLHPNNLPGDLPVGYKRQASGVVCRIMIDETGVAHDAPICNYPIESPWLQPEPIYTLNFSTITELGRKTQIAVPLKEVATKDTLRKMLFSQGLTFKEAESKTIQEFFVSWIEHLQKTKSAVITTAPFGWATKANGDVEGFIFGGKKFTPLGESGASNPDPIIAKQYRPTGSPDIWKKSAEMITSQGRPALDAIIASAFAGPLVFFTNEPGILLSTFSQESGIGKSTALRTAQAVWGNPVTATQGTNDTANNTNKKMGQIRNLPVYWDEIKSEEDSKRFVTIAFDMTKRREKGRLSQSGQMRESGEWQTMMVSASNDTIMDHVMSHTKDTLAGFYRVFEYEVPPWSNRGKIDQALASKIHGSLDHHYGQIGLEYAKFLGTNHAKVQQQVEHFYKQIGQEMQFQIEERFWRVMVTALLMGATYSNTLGFTKIDMSVLKAFLFATVKNMRNLMYKSPVDMKKEINMSNVLAQFLNQMRSRHTLRTNIIHRKPGKPPSGVVNTTNTDLSKLDAIYVQIGVEDKCLRVSRTQFGKWLEDNGYSKFLYSRQLEKDFGAREVHARMGAGTNYAIPLEYLIEIDLTKTKYANFLDET